MPTALPHQIEGARFLSERRCALLADAPRVGKTGAAILAADDILARKILVITTASGRPVWVRGFADWSMFPRNVAALYPGESRKAFDAADVQIVGWAALDKMRDAGPWDLIIPDENHYAKSVDAKRTQHLYGPMKGLSRGAGLCDRAGIIWPLTGTPIPNAPNDLYPTLRALVPERLTDEWGPTDVTRYDDFLRRYCIVRQKQISRFNKIDVVVGGRNLEELKARLDGFILRRTQQDVGIRPPNFEILPIHISAAQRRALEAEIPDAEEILDAAETGETKSLEMHLGPLRRITGTIKTRGVVDLVREEISDGLDKIVLMAWHKDTLDALQEGLSDLGVVRVDGASTAKHRDAAQQTFAGNPGVKVFLGQIVACGEAIDLSASAELLFVESSFVPKDMAQASLRITNHGQTRQPRVRVAALEGSIDEALQTILVRKVETIREVLT